MEYENEKKSSWAWKYPCDIKGFGYDLKTTSRKLIRGKAININFK